MYREIDFVNSKKLNNPLFIDVRSESEFAHSSIINSVNMPILNDKERQIVGSLYVNCEQDKAKSLGVEFASKKLPSYFDYILEEYRKRDIVIYCSRGGYRSSVLVNLLYALDVKVYKLKYGYKGYRKYVLNELENLCTTFDFVNLNGLTGVGKTKILKALKEKGANVLNLEELANHRGSLLGNIENNKQPSQKYFESLLLNELESFKGKTVFVESESSKIGNIFVPKVLYTAYSNSKNQVLINLSLDKRIEVIEDEYIFDDENINEKILTSLEELSRYIGKKRFENYKNLLNSKNYSEIIKDLIINYYDLNYNLRKEDFSLTIENDNPLKSADLLIEKYL